MWSRSVLLKYWAIQLPPTVLAIAVLLLLEWPHWIVWTLAALLVAKDIVLYPFAWRAYDANAAAALPYPAQGAQGVAVEAIDPAGGVRIWGELWRAELSHGARAIAPGEPVQVTGRRGLTLLVEAGSRQ